MLGGRKVSLPALMDTNNELLDHVTRQSVIIVGYRAIETLLPPPFRKARLHWGSGDVPQIITATKGGFPCV